MEGATHILELIKNNNEEGVIDELYLSFKQIKEDDLICSMQENLIPRIKTIIEVFEDLFKPEHIAELKELYSIENSQKNK